MSEAGIQCPHCGSGAVCKLAQSEAGQRYQCGRCVETFVISRERLAGDVATGDSRKETQVPKTKLACAKGCGKEFVHPKRKDTHEAKCRGAGNDGSVEEDPDLPARPRKSARAGAHSGNGKVLDAALEELRKKRDALIAANPEILELDQTIAALEKIRGGGKKPDPS